MAVYEEIVKRNYISVGSPTITGSPIFMTGSSRTAYIKNTKALPSSVTEFDFITKFTVLAYRGLPLYVMADVSTNRSLYIHQTSYTLTFYDSSNSYVNGTTTLSEGRTYWFRMRVSGGVLDLYTLDDSSGYSLDTLPPLSEWTHEVTKADFVNNLGSKTLGLGANPTYTQNSWLNGRIYLESTQLSVNGQVDWKPVERIRRDVSGSVNIKRGYYSDGVNDIALGTKDYNIDALTSGQLTGGKNKLFVYKDTSDNTGALLASTTPTGDFKITKDLEHPVYLSSRKNYIAGDTLQMGEPHFTNANAGDIWQQPALTSSTSYGTCTDSRNNTGERQEGWRALDNVSTTEFSPALEGGWWKWVVPETLHFISGESSIDITMGSPASSMTVQFFADEGATLPITDSYTLPGTVGAVVQIPVTNSRATNTIYMTIGSHSSWSEINEIDFTGVKVNVSSAVTVTLGKTLQYSESQDKSFWAPNGASVELSSVAASQNLGSANILYLINTANSDEAGISFTEDSEVNGAVSQFATPYNVYLTEDKQTILDISTRPGGITMSQDPIENFYVEGSPTISDDYIASDFSDSSYIAGNGTRTYAKGSVSSFELIMKITTGSSFAADSARLWQPESVVGSDDDAPNSPFVCIENGSVYLVFYEGGTYYKSLANSSSLVADTEYLLKWTYQSGDFITGYVSTDGGVSWSEGNSLNWRPQWAETGVVLGTRGGTRDTTFRGSIDLKECKLTINGNLWWAPVITNEGVLVAGWDVLQSGTIGIPGSSTYDYKATQIVPYSDLMHVSGNTIPDDYYIFYTPTGVRNLTLSDQLTDKVAFSGYVLHVEREGLLSPTYTYSLLKKGERCVIFEKKENATVSSFIAVPFSALREGVFTTAVGVAMFDTSATGSLFQYNMIASTRTCEYDSGTRTLTSAASVTQEPKEYKYVGDMNVILQR